MTNCVTYSDTGAFCAHWSDPTECEEMCRCGHLCHQHQGAKSNYETNRCDAASCDCAGFADKEKKSRPPV